jgi:hypothetical protein
MQRFRSVFPLTSVFDHHVQHCPSSDPRRYPPRFYAVLVVLSSVIHIMYRVNKRKKRTSGRRTVNKLEAVESVCSLLAVDMFPGTPRPYRRCLTLMGQSNPLCTLHHPIPSIIRLLTFYLCVYILVIFIHFRVYSSTHTRSGSAMSEVRGTL